MRTLRVLVAVGALLGVGGCGPHYTIPEADSDDIGKVISSGRSPKACIESLQEDAKELNVKVRLTDVQHQAASGPIAWIYSNSYTCTGKVISRRASSRESGREAQN